MKTLTAVEYHDIIKEQSEDEHDIDVIMARVTDHLKELYGDWELEDATEQERAAFRAWCEEEGIALYDYNPC